VSRPLIPLPLTPDPRALTDSLDKNKRRYQARVRRLELQAAPVVGAATDTASTRGSGRQGDQ
jgi:hypothetical protein